MMNDVSLRDRELIYEIRPIKPEEWLPDRCLSTADPLDPEAVAHQAGCVSLCRFFTQGSRIRLVDLYHDALNRFGCCGFVAWADAQVIGYNNFFPATLASEVRFYGWGGEDNPNPGTLIHNCISVLRNDAFRRQRIGSNLIRHSLEWARQNGWERFEVHQVLPDTAAGFESEPKSCRSFWNQFGFQVIGHDKADQKTRKLYGVQTRYSLALELEDWYGDI